MARITGNAGVLTLNAVVRLGASNIVWTPTRDLPDATGMESSGAKQAVDGNVGATFSLTAHCDTVLAGNVASVQTGGAVPFVLDIDGRPTFRATGTCRISTATANVDVNGDVTIGIEATVEGVWVEART